MSGNYFLIIFAFFYSLSTGFAASDPSAPPSSSPAPSQPSTISTNSQALPPSQVLTTPQALITSPTQTVLPPGFADPALATEFLRVTDFSQGVGSAVAFSTGTRGSGDLPTVSRESLKDFISSGKLKASVLSHISTIDGTTTVFPSVTQAWLAMLRDGLVADISASKYVPSETCDSGFDPNSGARTTGGLQADVCWDLTLLVTNHASPETLIVLAIQAEAHHFGYDEGTVYAIGEMVGTAIR